MFKYKNSEITDLFQWDINIVLTFDRKDIAGQIVHFSNSSDKAYTRILDENCEVQIPNILLQEAKQLEVYLYIYEEKTGYTKTRKFINVLPRPKPDSYVYEDDPGYIDISKIQNDVNELKEKIDITIINGGTAEQF